MPRATAWEAHRLERGFLHLLRFLTCLGGGGEGSCHSPPTSYLKLKDLWTFALWGEGKRYLETSHIKVSAVEHEEAGGAGDSVQLIAIHQQLPTRAVCRAALPAVSWDPRKEEETQAGGRRGGREMRLKPDHPQGHPGGILRGLGEQARREGGGDAVREGVPGGPCLRALKSGRGLDGTGEGSGKSQALRREPRGVLILPRPHTSTTSILPAGTKGARGLASRLSPSSVCEPPVSWVCPHLTDTETGSEGKQNLAKITRQVGARRDT